ncbi:MAG TPA: MSHA biogenesis protein MshK [Noviherbaspirillum sp.]|uniref:MSHA biogenesis protein MshK n=1 Tax=Noviherbaspirillum sp. TaxID=1926288 RepID=UPI002DDD9259|nr:MSHA biogenesis protein MshK [Noviherbaspirillum sp.]HEV2610412.1 MSHA biogenesis protein MshK [Noviherbaspirillum sp.]
MLITSSVAFAGELADPTRPPPAFENPAQGVAANNGPVLQSVLLAPGRNEAVISGQTVKVGQRLGEMRVEKITESEVVLRNGKDALTLKLFPEIEKKPVIRKPDSRSAG